MPPKEKESKYEKVAFMGQVPVLVAGKVKAGDFIIPSGLNDGVGLAVSKKEITIDQINKIVGVAWSDKLENGIGKVNLSIGVGKEELSSMFNMLNNRFNDLESRILAIENSSNISSVKQSNVDPVSYTHLRAHETS
mgnify:CR=1 FL=1